MKIRRPGWLAIGVQAGLKVRARAMRQRFASVARDS